MPTPISMKGKILINARASNIIFTVYRVIVKSPISQTKLHFDPMYTRNTKMGTLANREGQDEILQNKHFVHFYIVC